MAEQKTRDQIDARWQWKLTDIYENEAAFEAAFARAGALTAKVASFKGKVALDPRAAVRAYFEASHELELVYTYAALQRDQDGANSASQALAARTESLMVQCESAGAYLEPELLSLPEGELEALMQDKDFAEYDEYIRKLIRRKAHTLTAPEEAVIASLGEVLQAPHNAFSMLSDVDIPFPVIKDENGEDAKLSHASYNRYIRSRDRGVRKAAYEGMMGAYKAFENTVDATYAASVKGDCAIAKMRHFGSALEASLFPGDIPVSVYDNLLAAVENSLPALNRYLALRKKTLGVDALHMYDLYVPIVREYDMKMTYPEAFQLVKKGLAPLGGEYAKLLDKAFSDGWIDVYENKSKRSGAYSWGAYGTHPYVLLNHNDNLDGAMTLAHELGHAMHSYHSDEALPYAKAQYSLFVAEVASTCNEMLLMRYLIANSESDTAKAYLLNQLLEEFRGTVFRQTMFAAFEKESHEMCERDEPLTAEKLSVMYKALNDKYYGGVCDVDECVAAEWLRIPHFYRAFYVYQYATGFSAAVCLSERILTMGAPAVADYFKFLSAGGSVPPIEALKLAGVDMSQKEPVERALKVFADTVSQLEKLL